ncbi:MAG: hypothetical protein NVSMB47_00990 [Polyangiales bacterium]
MSDRKEPGFKRDQLLDKPGIVGARWWHEGLQASTLTRRNSIRALLVAGGILGLGAIGLARAVSKDDDELPTERRPSLAIQREYGWNFGARTEKLTFDGVNYSQFDKGSLGRLEEALAPRDPRLRPYFVPTLLQSVTARPTSSLPNDPSPFAPIADVLLPIFTVAMLEAYQRGQALAQLFAKDARSVAVVVDLPGPESIAFAAGAAEVFELVFAIDNWPHPRGVVPAHATLAAAVYYQPLFQGREPRHGAPPMFILDRARLSAYSDDAGQFDNRHLASVPSDTNLAALEIERLLYVTPTFAEVLELDDLNDYFVSYARKNIDVKVVAATAFLEVAGSRYSYSGDVTDEKFWADYPWATSHSANHSAFPLGFREYAPVPRASPYSTGLGRVDHVHPRDFSTVLVELDKSTRAIVGAATTLRSGSTNRAGGAGCGG